MASDNKDISSGATPLPDSRQRGSAQAGHEGLPTPRRWLAVVSVSLGTILTTISGSMINVALPVLARDFHVSSSSTVLIVTVYQLVLMMTLLPFSALGDRFGHRAMYQYGQLVFVVATLLSFFANSLPFLVLVRGFQAAGAAAAMSVSSALIREIYPSRQLGRGLSLNTVMAASFASLAPSVGGAILSFARWPWLFAILVPFGIFSILIGHRSLPEPVIHEGNFDVLGAVLCAATFGLAVIGLESGLHGDSPVISSALVVLGVTIGVFFVRREKEQPRPMLPIDLLQQRDIAWPVVGLFAAYVASMIVMVNLPFRLQQEYHYTPAAAGTVLAVWPLVSLFVAPTSGLLSDRYPAAILGAIGMVIAIVGLTALALLPVAPTRLDLAWRILICGLGFGMFFSPNARQIIAAAPRPRIAAAGALSTTTRGASQTLGATIAGGLLAAGLGNGPASGFVAAGLAAVAGVCSLIALRPSSRVAIEDLPEF